MSGAAVAAAAALAAVGHLFLWLSCINRLHGWAGPRRLIDALTLACFGLLAGVPLALAGGLAAQAWQSGSPAALGTGLATATSHPYAVACVVVGALGIVLKTLWIEPRRYDRRVLLDWKADVDDRLLGAAERPIAGVVTQLLDRIPRNEALLLSTDRKQLGLSRLPARLEGLRLVHLSDLHLTGRLTRPFYARMVETTNELEPDVICLTGDLIEHEACWPWLTDPLGRLRARLGVFFVLGNHDYYIAADETRRRLEDCGFVSLTGRWVRRVWDGAEVLLAGNELPWSPPPTSLGALRPAPAPRPPDAAPDALRIVLCHTPDQFGWCCRAQADLALAGHTHGGQVQIPWLGSLASPSLHGTRYACGVFRRGQTVLHVTRGIAGKTPLRYRCPPEIAVLQLASALRDARVRSPLPATS